MKILFKTDIPLPLEKIKAGFDRELFLSLNPPWVEAKLDRFDGCKSGDEVHIQMKQFGLKQKWISKITDDQQNEKAWWFVDEGTLLPWPLESWKHIHRVEVTSTNSSQIIDDITFTCSSSILEKLIYPALWATFAVRPGRYRKFFSR